MKKQIYSFLALALMFLLTACGQNSESIHDTEKATNTNIDMPSSMSEYEHNIYTPNYLTEIDTWGWNLHSVSPEEDIQDFLEKFEFLHFHSWFEWEGAAYGLPIILWVDEPVSNVSFVFLNRVEVPISYISQHRGTTLEYINQGHIILHMGYKLITEKEMFRFDKLEPGEALVLTVTFAHYLIPQGGIIFTDSSGEKRYMFFHGIDQWQLGQSHFNLMPYNKNLPWWNELLWIDN